jgi:alpha-glucoside transport system permease protein
LPSHGTDPVLAISVGTTTGQMSLSRPTNNFHNAGTNGVADFGRRFLGAAGAILAAFALWQGFFFLRDSEAPKLVIAAAAVVWGVGGLAALYAGSAWVISRLPLSWSRRLEPFIFVGPGVLAVFYFLALPTVRTFIASLLNRDGTVFVGLANYVSVLTEPFMLITFRNNLMWLVFGAGLTVVFGLLVATLADHSRHEKLVKSIIFMPMAISLVGAGVIWKFVYAVKDVSEPQIGLLNAIVVAFGAEPQAWIAQLQPWNNLFLIVIVIWLQTGYSMVLFSAAIKAVPGEILEAARIDGAGEVRIFFQIIIPSIMGTVITVTATVIIFTLKIFDIVIVMTGGNFGTDVIATQFYNQYFVNRNFGLGSTIAIVLLILVTPVVIYNLRQLRRSEAR